MIWNVRDGEPAPTEADTLRIAAELGIKFNEEYKDFISRNNGGYVEEDNMFEIPPDNESCVDGVVALDKLPMCAVLSRTRPGQISSR